MTLRRTDWPSPTPFPALGTYPIHQLLWYLYLICATGAFAPSCTCRRTFLEANVSSSPESIKKSGELFRVTFVQVRCTMAIREKKCIDSVGNDILTKRKCGLVLVRFSGDRVEFDVITCYNTSRLA